eukprot:GEMP01085346.1.p1 GENE.GEMP01085346.1~~GEMP01085346.1.p1  ORF type:complete len:265 (+),score=38.51 GEMP01085346.1:87-797(+)
MIPIAVATAFDGHSMHPHHFTTFAYFDSPGVHLDPGHEPFATRPSMGKVELMAKMEHVRADLAKTLKEVQSGLKTVKEVVAPLKSAAKAFLPIDALENALQKVASSAKSVTGETKIDLKSLLPDPDNLFESLGFLLAMKNVSPLKNIPTDSKMLWTDEKYHHDHVPFRYNAQMSYPMLRQLPVVPPVWENGPGIDDDFDAFVSAANGHHVAPSAFPTESGEQELPHAPSSVNSFVF